MGEAEAADGCALRAHLPALGLSLGSSIATVEFLSKLRPVGAVQAPVLNRFGDVLGLQACRVFQVGYGAGDFQDAVVGASTQALLSHGAFEEALAIRR